MKWLHRMASQDHQDSTFYIQGIRHIHLPSPTEHQIKTNRTTYAQPQEILHNCTERTSQTILSPHVIWGNVQLPNHKESQTKRSSWTQSQCPSPVRSLPRPQNFIPQPYWAQLQHGRYHSSTHNNTAASTNHKGEHITEHDNTYAL